MELEGILLGATIGAVITSIYFAAMSEIRRKRKFRRQLDTSLVTGQVDTGIEITQLEHDMYHDEGRVGQLAKVQMLVLKEMGKEHRVEPAKDVLVTVGDLPDLKKSKGRSA